MEEVKIKKGVDVYLYYWVIPFLLFFFLVNYFLPVFQVEALDVRLMISVVSFLFGFLISISFSMILSRVSVLRDSLAAEAGRLVSLFELSKNLGKNFHEKIIEHIDEYTIDTLRNYTSYEIGREYVSKMYEDLKHIELKSDFQKQISSSFIATLNDFELIREKLEYSLSTKLLPAIKYANYTLALILVTLLFYNRGDTFTNGLFIVISGVIIFILLIIEDYESLKIGDYVNNISNSEQIFDLIGRHRYYPGSVLGRVNLEEGRVYRIGLYDPKEKKEKVFTLTYNKSFRFKLTAIINKLWNRRQANDNAKI